MCISFILSLLFYNLFNTEHPHSTHLIRKAWVSVKVWSSWRAIVSRMCCKLVSGKILHIYYIRILFFLLWVFIYLFIYFYIFVAVFVWYISLGGNIMDKTGFCLCVWNVFEVTLVCWGYFFKNIFAGVLMCFLRTEYRYLLD